jgi:hypothetical protein
LEQEAERVEGVRSGRILRQDATEEFLGLKMAPAPAKHVGMRDPDLERRVRPCCRDPKGSREVVVADHAPNLAEQRMCCQIVRPLVENRHERRLGVAMALFEEQFLRRLQRRIQTTQAYINATFACIFVLLRRK